MADEDIINRLHDVFQVGSVSYRHNKRKDGSIRKPTWIWSVQNHAGIEHVINSIMDYLGERRKAKAQELLDYIERRKARLDHAGS